MSLTRTEPDWNAYAAELAVKSREELAEELAAWMQAIRVVEHLSARQPRLEGTADGLGALMARLRLVERATLKHASGGR